MPVDIAIGPGGPGATRVEAEATVGGVIDIWVAKEEGEKLHFHWEIAEMDPPNRLVFDFAFGGPIGSELTDERSRLTFEFREDGTGSTELTLVHDRLSTEVAANVTSGWTTITDRLTDYLEAKAPSNEVTGKD